VTELNGLERAPAPSFNTPQIAVPFEITATGLVREVEQDSLDEIAISVQNILAYRIGDRVELPVFGVPEPLFRLTSEDVSSILAEHVSRWEDRAQIFIEERPGDWDNMVRQFIVEIQGRTEQ
jgi:phage baseplate assembly protein W